MNHGYAIKSATGTGFAYIPANNNQGEVTMKNSFWAAASAVGLVVLGSLFVQTAQAAAQVYTFTASNFTSYNGTPVPYAAISGHVTLDGTNVTGLNLTIGDRTYSPSEVGYFALDYPAGSSGVVGAYKATSWDDARSVSTNTDDFMLQADFANPQNFAGFTYSVAALNDIFDSTNVSISVSAVPEPDIYAMLASGLGMLVVAVRRKRRE